MDEWIREVVGCVCVCVYTVKYYSSMKKEEILLFVITWIDLEGIMLNDVRHIKTKTV